MIGLSRHINLRKTMEKSGTDSGYAYKKTEEKFNGYWQTDMVEFLIKVVDIET